MTWPTSVPILVFLGLSVLELGPMYATDRRQTKASLNVFALTGWGIITVAGANLVNTAQSQRDCAVSTTL